MATETQKNSPRGPVANRRLGANVKSGLCRATKWDFEDGTFALYVPADPETSVLREWLWGMVAPMAQYMGPRGVHGWQWRLRFGEHRAVWAAK